MNRCGSRQNNETASRFALMLNPIFMRPHGFIYIFFFFAPFFAYPAHASYIRLDTRFTIEPIPNGVRLELFIHNQGDEAAHFLQSKAMIASAVQHTRALPRVKPGQAIQIPLFFDIQFPSPGRYPLVLRTAYQDKNGHRFSALNCGFYVYKKAAPSALLINSVNAKLPEKGKNTIVFKCQNTSASVHDVIFKLHLPDELRTDTPVQKISLEPNEQRNIKFMIENLSALKGSSYAVWLVGEYVDHHKNWRNSVSKASVMEITPQKVFFKLPQCVWIMLDSILIVLFVFLQFKDWFQKQS